MKARQVVTAEGSEVLVSDPTGYPGPRPTLVQVRDTEGRAVRVAFDQGSLAQLVQVLTEQVRRG